MTTIVIKNVRLAFPQLFSPKAAPAPKAAHKTYGPVPHRKWSHA